MVRAAHHAGFRRIVGVLSENDGNGRPVRNHATKAPELAFSPRPLRDESVPLYPSGADTLPISPGRPADAAGENARAMALNGDSG
jgi:hypothetical protein